MMWIPDSVRYIHRYEESWDNYYVVDTTEPGDPYPGDNEQRRYYHLTDGRLVRIDFDGRDKCGCCQEYSGAHYYHGPAGEERLICKETIFREDHDGVTSWKLEYYIGAKDHEVKVLAEFSYGYPDHYCMNESLGGTTETSVVEWDPDTGEVLPSRWAWGPGEGWSFLRMHVAHWNIAWFWFGLAGRPGGRAHADAVWSYEENICKRMRVDL